MRDAFGREIDYLRISVTDRCNLRCRYCMPEEGIKLLSHKDILSYEQIAETAKAAVRLGIRKIRITGGEPLARKGIVGLVRMLRAIPGLKTLAMTTNGTLLAPIAAELAAAGLDSVNLSFDTLDSERYRFLTRRGELFKALAGLDSAIGAGFAVKINMVILSDTRKSEIEAMRDFSRAKGVALQTIAQYSLQEKKRDDYGYDRPPPCSSCNRIRLTADGCLRSCLHSDLDFKVDFDDIEGSIRTAIMRKPAHGAVSSTPSVGQIGG
ncbi:MAG: radical SAM protein [Spirochaetes bacterium]|nr:radical SAM protein [Spirochaetota bacterium]